MKITVPLTLEVDLDIGLAHAINMDWLKADVRAAVLDYVLNDAQKYKLMQKITELTGWDMNDIEQGD